MKFKSVFLISFLILVSFSYADFDKVDEQILNEIDANGTANVLVVYNNNVGFFVKSEVDVQDVLNDVPEFESANILEDLNVIAGKVDSYTLEKLVESKYVNEIRFDYPVHSFLSTAVDLVNSSGVNKLKVDGINLTGIDQTVCIVDTGINYSLSSLGGGLGAGFRVVSGYDYVNSDNNPMDDHGHGTNVAGIIGGYNTVTGVAPNVTLAAVKILDSAGSGTTANLLSGLQWCIDNQTRFNITVVSMSLGCGGFSGYCDSSTTCNSDLIATKINDAVSKNVSIIVATGNDGSTTNIASPACIKNVTSVSATNKTDGFYSNGNRNNITDLVAPGVSIVSLGISGSTTTVSGTSMAAPFVAGAFVIINQYLKLENNTVYTPIQMSRLVNATGKQLNDTSNGLNFSRLDIYAALQNVDSENPGLNVSSPLNRTYYQRVIDLNFTASDVLLDQKFYELNNVNTTLAGNSSLNFSSGSRTLFVYANDTNGNLNRSVISLFVNDSYPEVTLSNTSVSSGNITLTCSSADYYQLSNVTLYHNLTGNFAINKTLSLSAEKSTVNFNLGFNRNVNFLWNCLVYDNDTNYDWGSSNLTISVDVNEAPNITSNSPTNLTPSLNENSTLDFTHSSNDSNGDYLSYSWYLDHVRNVTTQNYTYKPGFGDSGFHNVTLIVNDTELFDTVSWNVSVENFIVCSNGINETGESCDKNDFSGATCTAYGFNSGSLSCSSSCSIVTSGCSNTVGGAGGGSGGGSSGNQQQEVQIPIVKQLSVSGNSDEISDPAQVLVANDLEDEIEIQKQNSEIKPEETITGFGVYDPKTVKIGFGVLISLVIIAGSILLYRTFFD